MALQLPARTAAAETFDAPAGISLVEKIFNRLGFTVAERLKVLGISRSTYDEWRKKPPRRVSRWQIEALGYVIGIYDYSISLFGSLENVKIFLNAEDLESPFNGRSPRIMMTSGLFADVAGVFHWLLAQAQGL
jgi:uncharacterized protein (DUF2384 family)